MDNRPIGVFDSGVGGLTVVKELMKVLPNEDIIYFGDTGRVPYGTRSRETVLKYAAEDIAFLEKNNVKMIIAACGTVSSIVGSASVTSCGLDYTGVVVPASQAACSLSPSGRIGVIGTTATIRSGAYGKAIRNIRAEARVIGKDCPLFVPLVENGYFNFDNEVTRLVAKDYLKVFDNEDIDTLILGCTHFPLLSEIISEYFNYSVTLIDPGYETARHCASVLTSKQMLNDSGKPGTYHYYVSDSPENFSSCAEMFLKKSIVGQVEKIDLDAL